MRSFFTPSVFTPVGRMTRRVCPTRMIEKMSLPLFTYFLDILDKYCGDFLRHISKQISEHVDDILSRKDLR